MSAHAVPTHCNNHSVGNVFQSSAQLSLQRPMSMKGGVWMEDGVGMVDLGGQLGITQ